MRPGDEIKVGTKSLKFIKVSNSTAKRPGKAEFAAQKLDDQYQKGFTDKNSSNTKPTSSKETGGTGTTTSGSTQGEKLYSAKETTSNPAYGSMSSTSNSTGLSGSKKNKTKETGPEMGEGAAIFQYSDS